jgi:hypothetical protein
MFVVFELRVDVFFGGGGGARLDLRYKVLNFYSSLLTEDK